MPELYLLLSSCSNAAALNEWIFLLFLLLFFLILSWGVSHFLEFGAISKLRLPHLSSQRGASCQDMQWFSARGLPCL